MGNKYTVDDIKLLADKLLKATFDKDIEKWFIEYLEHYKYDPVLIEESMSKNCETMYHNDYELFETYAYSFMFGEEFEDLPMYIGEQDMDIKVIAEWRLQIGK